MGARLCQTLVTFGADSGQLEGRTEASQVFFYVVSGQVQATVGDDSRILSQGKFVYVPAGGQDYTLKNPTAGTQVLTFHKVYEPLAGLETPRACWGEKDDSKAPVYMNDEALRIQELLPNELAFDMAVNIFTYQPGGNLPMVETHVMEHGLLYLQGQAIYMLDQQWYPVQKGDAIWMGPFCQQWAASIGKEPSVYIYYKNVNRFPTVI
jgi:(S)-ureidoglycine aminohydrolase